jgi:hypothetical protein
VLSSMTGFSILVREKRLETNIDRREFLRRLRSFPDMSAWALGKLWDNVA